MGISSDDYIVARVFGQANKAINIYDITPMF